MKELKFTYPEIEVIEIKATDVIATSNPDNVLGTDDLDDVLGQ